MLLFVLVTLNTRLKTRIRVHLRLPSLCGLCWPVYRVHIHRFIYRRCHGYLPSGQNAVCQGRRLYLCLSTAWPITWHPAGTHPGIQVSNAYCLSERSQRPPFASRFSPKGSGKSVDSLLKRLFADTFRLVRCDTDRQWIIGIQHWSILSRLSAQCC